MEDNNCELKVKELGSKFSKIMLGLFGLIFFGYAIYSLFLITSITEISYVFSWPIMFLLILLGAGYINIGVFIFSTVIFFVMMYKIKYCYNYLNSEKLNQIKSLSMFLLFFNIIYLVYEYFCGEVCYLGGSETICEHGVDILSINLIIISNSIYATICGIIFYLKAKKYIINPFVKDSSIDGLIK